MSELRSRIESAEMPIADSLHAILILRALPPSYEVMQQAILANVSDYKKLTSADMRARIISEELRQTTTAVNAIRPGRKSATCSWCGGGGHMERECRKKLRGLSKEEAHSEQKRIVAKRKEEAEAAKKDSPTVSTTIQETPSDTSSSSSSIVTVASTSIEPVILYIACETKWMLDSGCLDHITHEISDFSEYRCLPTPQHIRLADGSTCVSYVGIGTVTATTRAKGLEKHIML